jgi:hypothetical protein
VYLGTEGRGIIYGQLVGTPADTATEVVRLGQNKATIPESLRKVGSGVHAAQSIQIFDLQGNLLRRSGPQSQNQAYVSLEGLQNGVYLAVSGTQKLLIHWTH